jgi:phosphohistidine phosphatase
MKVLLVRHAIAVDRDTPGLSDHLRPLTEDGATRFRKTARALSALITPDVVFTSPALRTKQTAEILARQWPQTPLEESEPLGNGSRAQFEIALSRVNGAKLVAAVGHEPWLSEWTAEWLGASHADSFAFKKGGAALLEFDEGVREAGGRLVFFLGPKAIKDLAGSA